MRGIVMKQGIIMYALILAIGTLIGVFVTRHVPVCTDREDVLPMSYELKNIVDLFSIRPDQIEGIVATVTTNVTKKVDEIIAVKNEERTFQNTVIALDRVSTFDYSIPLRSLYIIGQVHPDKQMRDTALEAVVILEKLSVDLFDQNYRLYQAVKAYAEGNALAETLDDEQRYFLSETMRDYKRSGMELPTQQREQIKTLEKELSDLTTQFDNNISNETRTIAVAENELSGLNKEYIATLKKESDGLYQLGTDYPTVTMVMQHCTNAQTRKKMFDLFNNRAYPENKSLLDTIIQKRHELAVLLGYESYAEYSISNLMATSTDRVETFLNEIIDKAQPKEQKEFQQLTQQLPDGVILTTDGKMQQYDRGFVNESYKKRQYNLDDRTIAEYFPMEHTIQALLDIYTQFMNLGFKQVPCTGLWDREVRVLQVTDTHTHKDLGYLFLDLYPRPGKYTHACFIGLIPAHYSNQNPNHVAAGVVLANFPAPTEHKPSLLKLNDVRTFFHEFGHALHALLGRTEMYGFSGTRVKRDFVEMPSQMLEEWLWDKEILQKVSKHYSSGEPLPDTMIDSIIALKNFDTGSTTLQQAYYAKFSLECFKKNVGIDVKALQDDLYKKIRSDMQMVPDNHFYASFGHLTGYGAGYYGYLWSKVFALDLFGVIKKQGLLNQEIGRKYVNSILVPGGSKDPNALLIDFLGRDPNQEAFFIDLGLN
jgi:thimet oligopeptidase